MLPSLIIHDDIASIFLLLFVEDITILLIYSQDREVILFDMAFYWTDFVSRK